LINALARTEPTARAFSTLLAAHSALEVANILPSPDQVVAAIDDVVARPEVRQFGLGHSLAEAGRLPMYGMPTRVRDLFTGIRSSVIRGLDWATIDRDIDIAIYEFAPGSNIVKDKRTHRCVGFTG